jgi:hypothetical protein
MAFLGLAISGCAKEAHLIVTINESGGVQMAETMVVDRALMEQQMKNMDGGDENGEKGEDDEAAPGEKTPAPQPPTEKPAGAAPPADTKAPVTAETAVAAPGTAKPAAGPASPEQDQARKDAALAAKLKETIENSGEFSRGGADIKVESVEVQKDTVKFKVVASFDDLEAFVAGHNSGMLESLFDRLQIEKDENGKLRLTLSSPGASPDEVKMKVAQLGQTAGVSGFKGSLAFVMPGKIISSTLPTTENNTTRLAVDAAKADTLAVLEKLVTGSVVIVAEPGKLVMDALPLDSKKLTSDDGDSPGDGRLPIVEAGAGCDAEALGVSTTLTHVFPEARDYFKDQPWIFTNAGETGCRIEARAFVPKGKSILGLGEVKVTKAVDDQGREIKVSEPSANDSGRYSYSRSDDGESRSTAFSIQMAAPQPGTQTIEKVQGEVILKTCSGWKEQELADPQADAQKSISLANVISGASVTITKVKAGKARKDSLSGTIAMKITGPAEIAQMDFRVKIQGMEQANAYVNTSRMTTEKGQKVRILSVQYNAYRSGPPAIGVEAAPNPKVILIPRYPATLKRERVKFVLKAIDLF